MSRSSTTKPASRKPDRNGFAVGDAVWVLDVLAWQVHRGTLAQPVLGVYSVRLDDGRTRNFESHLVKLVSELPQPSLF